MPRLCSPAFVRQELRVDFVGLKHACPKGVYVAPVPDEPQLWSGVLFVRKGPYANAVLRFHIAFPDDYPLHPPILTFLTDVFHPIVTPLTTYTYTTRDKGGDTVSAADDETLPPGGLSLRHGFPEWFESVPSVPISHVPGLQRSRPGLVGAEDGTASDAGAEPSPPGASVAPSLAPQASSPPHIVEVLQYLRVVFDTESVIDAVPLSAAANTGAWHAWRSHRSKVLDAKDAPSSRPSRGRNGSETSSEAGVSPRPQPGGARRPGEWNWTGVWEDRVRKAVQASLSESMLYGGDGSEAIGFVKMDDNALSSMASVAGPETRQVV